MSGPTIGYTGHRTAIALRSIAAGEPGVRFQNIRSNKMAIFAVGAYYDEDVSDDFIKNNIAGPGWSKTDAPELHQYINSLKVGGIVYIKSA